MRLDNHTIRTIRYSSYSVNFDQKKKINAVYIDLALKKKKRNYRLGKPCSFPIKKLAFEEKIVCG